MQMKKIVVALAPLALAGSVMAGTVVEFGEVPGAASIPLIGGPVLLDNNPASFDFTAYGLAFEDTTFLDRDPVLFNLAGEDGFGITNHNNLGFGGAAMTVVFLDGASSVTFDWYAILASDFFANAYDAQGNLVDSFANTDTSIFGDIGTTTLTGDIHKITFFDGGQRIGVGRIEFDTSALQAVPLPSAAAMGATGLLVVARRRRVA